MSKAVSVTRWGDWAVLNQVGTAGFAYRLKQATEAGLKADAQGIARRLKHNLRARTYAANWPALSDQTKRTVNEDRTQLLIDTGAYVNAIKARHVGFGRWEVGVFDPENAEKGLTHEYGGTTSKGVRIPMRPHWRVEMARLQAGGVGGLTVTEFARRALQGFRARSKFDAPAFMAFGDDDGEDDE